MVDRSDNVTRLASLDGTYQQTEHKEALRWPTWTDNCCSVCKN